MMWPKRIRLTQKTTRALADPLDFVLPDLPASHSAAAADPLECLSDMSDEQRESDDELKCFDSSMDRAWWVRRLSKCLDADQFNNLMNHKALSYASDATGANAPFEALKAIQVLFEENGAVLELQHVFASEEPTSKGDGARAFIEMNGAPTTVFADMCARGEMSGPTITGERRLVLHSTLYAAGFECHDLCTLNRFPKPLDSALTEQSGNSSKTLHSSFRYIKSHRPRVDELQVVIPQPHSHYKSTSRLDNARSFSKRWQK
jgi:hypothetical protein